MGWTHHRAKKELLNRYFKAVDGFLLNVPATLSWPEVHPIQLPAKKL